ncbi:hybrid sensor histidine kinase/response regulator [Rugamonas sp.]|uniref:hybrid sensor histidine kinase/response regulator n=1 Tax=Rugamonas sp. TaxID=1926287 RepID=UPI0025FFAD66|nr:hybrid sensor histidine kinase/response regulator [Rugamonas sp.]
MREAARRKDEFLASLGHELRNPLAPIRTSVALLGHLYPDAPPMVRISAVIDRQVTHLTRLVDDLLDVARITSGKISLQRERISFTAVIQHVIELSAQAATAKHIAIDSSLPDHDLTLDADYARVVQICANILSNAIKFTPAQGRIALRGWREGRCLCVSIADNGIGIQAASLACIFGMFEQSGVVKGQLSSGLGIGLSLSRQFAQMHGGSVEAHSGGIGMGSEFVIRLPVICGDGDENEDNDSGAADKAINASGGDGGGAKRARVLIADDNRDAADALRALLEMEGYEAESAYDGNAAVAAAARALPDLVVMDLGMPGMDGYDAARLIRQRAGAENILMIALTGWGQSDARRRTVEAGFDHHLIKPVDVEQILKLAAARR